MASGRSYRVQYSTKRTNQVKRRPWTSPGSAGDIFDKLKSSVTSDKETVESALTEAPSYQEKNVSHYLDEYAASSTESSQELRKEVARDSKPMYSYSHYPRYIHFVYTCACSLNFCDRGTRPEFDSGI